MRQPGASLRELPLPAARRSRGRNARTLPGLRGRTLTGRSWASSLSAFPGSWYRPGAPPSFAIAPVSVPPQLAMMPGQWLYKNSCSFVHPQTKFAPPHTKDARIARPKHLDDRLRAQTYLLKAKDHVGRPLHGGDTGRLPGLQFSQRQVSLGNAPLSPRTASSPGKSNHDPLTRFDRSIEDGSLWTNTDGKNQDFGTALPFLSQ